jgi:hypothetical protein
MNAYATDTTTTLGSASPAPPVRLVFTQGVANLRIRADGSMPDTYRAEFYGPKPRVTEANGAITIEYQRFNPFIWGRTSADVVLSPSVTWSIEIRGGVAHWDGDLRNLAITGIEVLGGASKIDLQLPRPRGTVLVRVSGGASHLTVRRPAGVPARVHIGGGASKLELDTQYLGAVGGPVRLETPDYSNATDRYDVEIGGGASKITVVHD